jgi:excisionase family DNA binding protein
MKEITTQETAERLKTTDRNVRYLCKRGTLKARKVGRDWLVSEKAVREREARDDGNTVGVGTEASGS